ncbi:MAG: FAD-binding domain-containing protein [Cyclobacteriaceae bacterium]|nr:deoxyribodipyrimidine photolyase [Flammeovirgaceae bacterium]
MSDSLSPVFPTDYQSILARIDQVNPLLYGRTRNFLNGAVTYLSPYISRGVISVKQVQQHVLKRGYPLEAIEKFLQELAWREYFQRIWQVKGDLLMHDLKQPQSEVAHRELIASLANARTGIQAIDTAIQQWYDTGYLHNHMRMYIASLMCNIGKAYWHMPSRWMYYHLLDGDVASNSCSWQWVAGAFSSKKYYCNQENINRFTTSFQQGTFLDTPTELLASLKIPNELSETIQWQGTTPLPQKQEIQIDWQKPTLLYNSYNLDPLWRKDEDVNRVLLLEPSHFEKFPVSEKVINFVLALSQNISSIQVYVGEVDDLVQLNTTTSEVSQNFISKEHPAFTHYPGQKDIRDWIYPTVTGYHSSFFAFWKKCSKEITTPDLFSGE